MTWLRVEVYINEVYNTSISNDFSEKTDANQSLKERGITSIHLIFTS